MTQGLAVRRAAAGFALIAVLWMVAALALLAAALVAGTRAEVDVLHGYQLATRAQALGDGAIHVVANRLRSLEPRPDRFVIEPVLVDGVEVEVRISPAAGFVDINAASEELLRDLIVHVGGVDAGDAAGIAAAIVAWRTRDGQPMEGADLAEGGRRVRFDVIEDLLQVPEVDFDLFDRMRNFVTTASGLQGVAPLAASPGMLSVLSSGDLDVAHSIAARREAEDPVIDMSRLNSQHIGSAQTGTYRVDAVVPSADGRVLVRSGWLALSPDGHGMPWSLFDLAPARGIAGAHDD